MDLHLFRPAVDSKGHFFVNGADILGAGDVSFGLVIDGGFGILPVNAFVNDDGVAAADASRADRVVERYLTGTLMFNVGIANRLVVGAQAPVQLVSGPNLTLPGQYNDDGGGLDYQGFGNLVLHAKVRLLRPERDPVGLAAIARVELPTGDASRFAGDPTLALWPELALEWRPHRRVRLGVDLGYRVVVGDGAAVRAGAETAPGDPSGNATRAMFVGGGSDLVYDDLLTFGVGLSVRAAEPLDVIAEVYGTQIASAFGEEHATSVEAIGGLKIFVDGRSYLLAGAGLGLSQGLQSADVRGLVGFVFEPSIGDRDGDGYKDDVDECPDEPEDFDGFADAEGCPDPDNDRDGILDDDDECHLVPEDHDGDADDDGCPEGNEGDRDGDGLLDDADECPDDPEDRDGFEEEDGCPDPDNDVDGVLDADDLCPNDPEDVDGFQEEDGCPDPDNDADRILDVDDACPMDPETYNGMEDEDGCPDRGEVELLGGSLVLFDEIHFATDSARILEESFHLLDAIAAALNGHPELEYVEIQGHADERGGDEYNIALTRDRAAAVREALAQRGVHRRRTRSAGYGERCPVDPRSNEEAWSRNRRVEIKVLRSTDGEVTDEEDIACPAGRELIPEG